MGRTIAEMFIDKGRAEGEIKGIEKGSLQKGREILLRLLRKRFKKVPRPIAARIASTTNVEELDTWLDNVVEAATIEEVGIK